MKKLSRPGKYTQQTANIDGLISSARGKRPARVKEAVGSVIAVASTGDDLDPVKACRRQKFLVGARNLSDSYVLNP